jgi:CheY-like chemotaxis protein
MLAATPRRVLVVDDEALIREVCADVLSSEGYTVATARNGREALDELTLRPANLVLMDIMMPVLDGLMACKELKEDARTCNIPVVLMSAAGNLKARAAEVNCLADAIVSKPFDLDQLLLTVEQLVA